MSRIPVHLPSLLLNCTGGANQVETHGNSLAEAIENLFMAYPLLRTHIYEEDGTQRQHVLIFHNDENIRWYEHLDIPTNPGDSITILQAVSGG